MVTKRKADPEPSTAVIESPRSVAIAATGVTTGEDFARLMSALMSDVIEGRISAETANAACNAGGKLLKVVEMQYRYQTKATEPRPAFRLIG